MPPTYDQDMSLSQYYKMNVNIYDTCGALIIQQDVNKPQNMIEPRTMSYTLHKYLMDFFVKQ